jgi:hypothetical protein
MFEGVAAQCDRIAQREWFDACSMTTDKLPERFERDMQRLADIATRISAKYSREALAEVARLEKA